MAISSEGKQVKLTLKEKLSYSAGKIPGGVFASFTGAINAFYYTWMGLDAYYILIGQVLYMIWNVINDPIFGYLQDGTRTKVGRYLPWIKFSAVPFTLGFIFLFFPPQNWRFQTGGQSYQIPLLIWYIVGQAIYDTFFTIVYLAHVSLAPQMTFDKKERIELNSIGSVMLFIGMGFSMAIPSIFLTEPTAEKIGYFKYLS